MPLFKKKEKKVTTYNEGKKVNDDDVPDTIPELKVPLPTMSEKERAVADYNAGYRAAMLEKAATVPPPEPEPVEEAEPDYADYFGRARDIGFVEGISFCMSTLRQAQNDIIRRQRGG